MFDFIVGNPPYQTEVEGDNELSNKPIYQYFVTTVNSYGEHTSIITPGRWLFNAGKTSKEWNKKMLNDPEITVQYFQDSKEVFTGVDIAGGVSIIQKEAGVDKGLGGVFIPNPIINQVKEKVCKDYTSFSSIVSIRGLHKYSSNSGFNGPIGTKDFERLSETFKINPAKNTSKILGLFKGKRSYRYIDEENFIKPSSYEQYKVFFPKAGGSRELLSVLPTSVIGEPREISTDTFLTIGGFNSRTEAENCQKYLHTKLLRVLLSILKVTQDNPKRVWEYIPLQDFTEKSDIDWTKDIADIDKQLYKKYSLTKEEIQFIEENVKIMV